MCLQRRQRQPSLRHQQYWRRFRLLHLKLHGVAGKEPIFAVGTTNGAGNINAFGASFGAETRDDEKLACITLFLDGVTGDVKDWVADRLGAAIINLNKLEEKLPAVLDEIAAEKANVLSNITVAQ